MQQGRESTSEAAQPASAGAAGKKRLGRPQLIASSWTAGLVLIAVAAAAWLGVKATTIERELKAATLLIPVLKENVASNKPEKASRTTEQLRAHAAAAREAAGDPLWTLASAIPGLGANFSAITEVARSADDVATLGVAPLVKVFQSLDWNKLLPSSGGTNFQPIQEAAPRVSSAAHAVRISADRLARIDSSGLLPQVAQPLSRAREQLEEVTGALDASADVTQVAPEMLGAGDARKYLLMIQNNAEARASGGIPGALAVLTLNKGKLTLEAQSSASAMGVMSPIVPVDVEQQQIYTPRLGKFMQDVNLTPDFPTAASTAQLMWKTKTGQIVDGVVSIDPVALGYILDATGPVKLNNPELLDLANVGLPTELTGTNVVPTLLSDVYAKIEEPTVQDAYFAGVAQEIFAALSSGKGDAKGLVEGVTQGASEGRVLVWSGSANEEDIIAKYPLSGSVTGPSISPSQFGVYFNDGTGAKMDYHMKRTVQLIKECPAGGYSQVKVRVTSTNTAPLDAATSLPEYVTGGGVFGVPAGIVQTNIVAYGPVQSNVESAVIDGKKAGFSSQQHSGRPVGSTTVSLAPGQRSTVEFTFGKIVQHTEPKLAVTPTVQPLKDVVLDTVSENCVPAP